MSKKFCTNCGHGNPSMTNGLPAKFCGSCGNNLTSLADFKERPSRRQAPPKRRSRWSQEEEDDYYEESEAKNIDKIVQGLKVNIDAGNSGPIKLDQIVAQDKTHLDRGRGAGYGSDVLKEWSKESDSSRDKPNEL